MDEANGLDLGYRRWLSPTCFFCRHFDHWHSCAAFPDENSIPVEIWNNPQQHHRPHPGDHGIQFAPKPGYDAQGRPVADLED